MQRRLFLELLEKRRLLATLSNTGASTLSIALAADETLSVVAEESTYYLTSNQHFQNAGVASSDFSSFENDNLRVLESGLSRYDKIEVRDTAGGASILFLDSGTHHFVDHFDIRFSSAEPKSIEFLGTTHFALSSSLTLHTPASVLVHPGAILSSDSADISVTAAADVSVRGAVLSHGGNISLHSDQEGDGVGRLQVADDSQSGWESIADLSDSDRGTYDFFGGKVRIDADGNTALVSAAFQDIGGNKDQGSVSVFVKEAGNWSLQQKLVAEDGQAEDQFGSSIALSADGNLAFVGVMEDDVDGSSNQGSVRIFERTGQSWNAIQTLHAENAFSGDLFGRDLAVSDNGETLIVTVLADSVAGNFRQGSARIFQRVNG